MDPPLPLRLLLALLTLPSLAGAAPDDAARDEAQARATGMLPGEIGTRDSLAQKLPEINVDGVGLTEVIDFVRDVSGLNVYVDWAGVEAAGVKRDTPVRVAAQGILLHDATNRVLESAAGGKGKLKADAVGRFVIVSTPKRLEATRARFRRLADKAPEGKLAKQLRRPLPEVNLDGVGLRDAMDFIRDVTGAKVDVDWDALKRAKIDQDTPVTLRMKNAPFDQALRLILDSAGGDKAVLDFQVKGEAILVTVAGDGVASSSQRRQRDRA